MLRYCLVPAGDAVVKPIRNDFVKRHTVDCEITDVKNGECVVDVACHGVAGILRIW